MSDFDRILWVRNHTTSRGVLRLSLKSSFCFPRGIRRVNSNEEPSASVSATFIGPLLARMEW